MDVQSLTLSDDATALYLYILPKGIIKMMPILEALRQKRLAEGKRLQVLSYMFQIHEWEATKTDETAKGSCPLYYYDFNGTTSSKIATRQQRREHPPKSEWERNI